MPASARAVISSHGVGPKDELGPPWTSMTSGACWVVSPCAGIHHVSTSPSWKCSTFLEKGPYHSLPSVVSLLSSPASTANTSLGWSLVAGMTTVGPPPVAMELQVASGSASASVEPSRPKRYGYA